MLYKNKEKEYFSRVRLDIINEIPCYGKKLKVLEVGCGLGSTLIELKKRGIAEYVAGIDIVELNQKTVLDNFVCGDVEKIEMLPYPENFFDIIICADVLEHLKDPWTTVKKLKKHLKEKGYFISSIPNIREYTVIGKIVFKGSFEYQEEGILDKTHLRFFCKKDMIKLFKEAGLEIEKVKPNFPTLQRYWLSKLTFKRLEEFLAVQYIILAKKL